MKYHQMRLVYRDQTYHTLASLSPNRAPCLERRCQALQRGPRRLRPPSIIWRSEKSVGLLDDLNRTVPQSKACWAFKDLPVKISSFALDAPINLGNLWVPPAPGIIPIRHSGNAILSTL